MGRKGIPLDDALDAIEGSGGMINLIAKRLKVSRQTIYNLRDKYATVQSAIEDERENLKDIAEAKLLDQINKGNLTAIIFYLKTQAKERGYIERAEITGANGKDLISPIVYLPQIEDDSASD